jgi:hypothetical protein
MQHFSRKNPDNFAFQVHQSGDLQTICHQAAVEALRGLRYYRIDFCLRSSVNGCILSNP